MSRTGVFEIVTGQSWDIETDVVVVGAGGCGMAAALAAADEGAKVLLLEKSRRPEGNTALSQGMVPAAGSRFQQEAGIADSPEAMAEDICRQNGYQSDPRLTLFLCQESKGLVEWLADRIGVNLRLVTDFKYTGFGQFRIHAPPTRTGRELMAQLQGAVARRANISLVTELPVRRLVTDDTGSVCGVAAGIAQEELVKCRKVVLACGGFGANHQMLEKYCPHIADALYFNHPGDVGEGIRWGMELGAAVEHMGAYQAHASVCSSQGMLVTWSVIVAGGIQVNLEGKRFGNETRKGYSDYALEVLRQPEQVVWEIFDDAIYQATLANFQEFRDLAETGAIRRADSIEELARILRLDVSKLGATLEAYNRVCLGGVDEFGRKGLQLALAPPLYGVQVTAALLHTQGGLRINTRAQVLRPDDSVIPNLYAGGGVAVGVSGSGVEGYLSGNGMLAALGWGRVAGQDASRSIRQGH